MVWYAVKTELIFIRSLTFRSFWSRRSLYTPRRGEVEQRMSRSPTYSHMKNHLFNTSNTNPQHNSPLSHGSQFNYQFSRLFILICFNCTYTVLY